MKRLGTLFFGVLCMILLFAFSHASGETSQPQKGIFWKETDSIKVAWDATTTHVGGSPITENEGKVKYLLYVEEQDTGVKRLVKKWVEGKKDPVSATDPIPETSCEIKFEVESGFKVGKKYLLGVQAGLYKFSIDEEIIGKPVFSPISWSCKDNCTSNNPFGVEFITK